MARARENHIKAADPKAADPKAADPKAPGQTPDLADAGQDGPVSGAGGGRAAPGDAGFAIAAGLAEAAAVVLVLRLLGPSLLLLGLVHLTTLALLAARVKVAGRAGRDTSTAVLALLATVATGPIGAIGAGLTGWWSRTAAGNPLLDAWYERISMSVAVDPVTRLCDNVGVGRTLDLGGPTPASFGATIEAGTLAERQTVLGLIARRFHADYLPMLQVALKSPEPTIRVQAAAVAVHVRPDITRLLHAAQAEVPAASADPRAALALLHRMEALVASGLLDESDRQRGWIMADRLGDLVAHGVAKGAALLPPRGSPGRAPLEATLERLLIGRRRFAELRTLRSRARALEPRPRARVRRLVSGEVHR